VSNLNDLSVFGVPGYGEPTEQPQQLSLVKRPPSYFDFQEVWTKMLQLKCVRTTAENYLQKLGATIKLNKEPKSPTITGLTWEHIEQMKAQVAEKEAKTQEKKAKKETPKATPAPVPQTAGTPAEVPPPTPPKEKPKTAAQQLKEFESIVRIAEKKGYAREDVTQHYAALQQDESVSEDEILWELTGWVAQLHDVSSAALKRQNAEKEALSVAQSESHAIDRVEAILNAKFVNPFDKKEYTGRQVVRTLSTIRSQMETRENEYIADMNELRSGEEGWKNCYGAQLNYFLKEEFKLRRRINAAGKAYYRPATIKLGWITAKRQRVEGGPQCTDKALFVQMVQKFKDPKVLEEFLSSLTDKQKLLFANCFKLDISIDWRACEIAVENGIKFDHWTIKETDEIGEPKLYFSKPRAVTAGVEEEEED